jgi:hypothetical protein
MTSRSQRASRTQRSPSPRLPRLLFAVPFAVLPLLVVLVRTDPAPVPAPQPDPTPVIQYVVDSGFHEAIDSEGAQYLIQMPYGAMNDVQKGDADRFGRAFPNGN